MPLNETQQRFLDKYINSRGDQYKALEELGLDLAHLLSWRENADFEVMFRDVTNKIITHLRQESFLIATKRINDAVKHGIKQEIFTQEHTIEPGYDSGGKPTIHNSYKAKQTVKNLGVPVAYLKLAMCETAIAKAIQALANEGALPLTVAKRILQRAESISTELANSFEIEENDNAISEQKIIAFIKQAVLKPGED